MDMEIESLEDEIFEVPTVDKLVDEWVDKNKDRIFIQIIPSYGQPQEIEFERVKVEGEEKLKIARTLIQEIINRMDEYGKYEIKKVEEAVAWKLLGKKLKKRNLIEDLEEYSKFADALAKVESVHNQIMGGTYLPTPQLFYTFVDSKPKSKRKYALAALGIMGLAAALAAYHELVYKPEQMKKPYRQAGLNDEQINEFFEKFPEQNGNSTWVEFAKVWVGDKELAEKSFDAFKSLSKTLSYINFVGDNGYDGLGFLKDFPEFTEDYTIVLPVYSKNSNLSRIIRNCFLRDSQIKIDRKALSLEAFKLYINLNLIDKNLSLPTIHALNNLTIAENQLSLPAFDKNTYFLLLNCTQKPEGKNLDFKPVIIKVDYFVTDKEIPIIESKYSYLDTIPEGVIINPSEDEVEKLFNRKENFSAVYVIGSSNIARDYWLIAENLRRRPELVEHPEWYLALCMMAQQNGYDFFENPEMRRYKLKPTSEEVWEIIDGLRDWLFNKDRMGFPLDLPWVSNANDKKIAYMILFELPTKAGDLEIYKRIEEYLYTALRNLPRDERRRLFREMIEKIKKENPHLTYHRGYIFHHKGLDAMKYTVEQMPKIYNEISREYPNGTFYYVPLGIELPPVNDFYGWLHDRRHHGFENGVAQLVGRKEFIDFNSPNLEDLYLTSNPESINTYLSTDESWNLFKFIFGYGGKYGGADKQMDFHYYNIAFKPFGIPYQLMHYGEHHIDAPMRYAGGFDGGIAGLPDYLLKQLKEGRFGEVLIMPGNTIDPLGIGLEGVKKDLAYGMENQVEPNLKYSTSFLNLRGMKIFFFSGGRKG